MTSKKTTKKKKRKPGSGGARAGAGRPPFPEGKIMIRQNLTIDAKTIASAKKIGQGNKSLGVRLAVAAYFRATKNLSDVRRPALPEDETMVRRNFTMDRKTRAGAKKLGQGNISLGIRLAVAAYTGSQKAAGAPKYP